MKLLIQMAETLEDQAAGLYRRAAASEEEEFLLNREIEERQTEINRLVLKLDAMRAERDRVMEKIGAISAEATAMREEIFNGEEEFALAAIVASPAVGAAGAAVSDCEQPEAIHVDPASGARFFRRLEPTEQTPNS